MEDVNLFEMRMKDAYNNVKFQRCSVLPGLKVTRTVIT